MTKSNIKSLIPLLILVILFITSTYLANTYSDYFTHLVNITGIWGILSYITLAIFTTVIAPLSSIPLMPIASHVWGVTVVAFASILGWWIGSLIAFCLSRKYGRIFVEKIISKEKLESIEKRIPEKNIFWTIIVLRILIPVDLLSYALGLFTIISWRSYALASLIGIIPFAFIFAYIGTM